MEEYVYTLLPHGKSIITGEDNLEKSYGKVINTKAFTLLYIVKGSAEVLLNYQPRKFSEGEICMISDGPSLMIQQASDDFRVRYVVVDYNLMEDVYYHVSENTAWMFLEKHQIFKVPESRKEILNIHYQEFRWIEHQCPEASQPMLLINLLIVILTELSIDIVRFQPFIHSDDTKLSRKKELAMQFYELVTHHFREHRDIGFYARQLCISEDYLYKVSQEGLMASPKEMIKWQIILEMKNLLRFSSMSINDIARRLHFEETSYMCRFFKKAMGMTPLQYRNKKQK